MIRFHLITLFPEACEAYLSASILGRARSDKKMNVSYQNPRSFVDLPKDKKKNEFSYRKVDERPYGGGPGMVMMALPVVKAVQKSLVRAKGKTAVIWFQPGAKVFDNKEADKLLKYDDVVLICGRYEGIDERAKKMVKTMGTLKTYSVGEAVYTGGELPAMAIVDAVTRRIPGVLGKDESVEERRVASHASYTRPEVITFGAKKYKVPSILLTGHAAKIEEWRKKGN